MSLDYTVERWEVWPRKATPAGDHKRSPFKGVWSRVLADLDREIRMLGGERVIFRLNVNPGHIRVDGQLRADARPYTPGVIIEFTAAKLDRGPRLAYACDQYGYWQANVIAIARTLEALRAVERYGATSGVEQYAGFKALPSGNAGDSPMSVHVAAHVVASYSSSVEPAQVVSSPDAAKQAVRAAVHRTHPDRNNGDRSAFDNVDKARAVLASHHGVSL